MKDTAVTAALKLAVHTLRVEGKEDLADICAGIFGVREGRPVRTALDLLKQYEIDRETYKGFPSRERLRAWSEWREDARATIKAENDPSVVTALNIMLGAFDSGSRKTPRDPKQAKALKMAHAALGHYSTRKR